MIINPPEAANTIDVDFFADDLSVHVDMADALSVEDVMEQEQQTANGNPEMEALLAKFSAEIKSLKETVAELKAQKKQDVTPRPKQVSILTTTESMDLSQPSMSALPGSSHVSRSIASRSSRFLMRPISFFGSLFNLNEEEVTDQRLHEDTYSFILLSPLCGYSFVLGVCVFMTQQAVFMLMLWSLTDYHEMGYGIPVNVNMGVRLGQMIALVFVVIMQTDIIKGLDLVRLIQNESFHEAVPDLKTWRIPLCIATLLLEGSIGILVSFMLVVTSDTVINLLLNFTAMAFVSELDEAVFFATRYGFFGLQCEADADKVNNVSYKVHRKAGRKGEIVLLSLMFGALFAGWAAVLHRQNQGVYQCSSIMVQFGDEVVPALGTFSGIYDEESSVSGAAFLSRRVQYVERASKRAKFGYCDELLAWTFHWQDETSDNDDLEDFLESNPCSNWKARSTRTTTYDLAETLTTPWYIKDEHQREVILGLFSLECYDCDLNDGTSLQCSGRGACSEETALCTCDSENGGWIGPRCEFPEPCETLAFDARFGAFPSHRGWADTLDILRDSAGRPVMLHHKPIYAKENSLGTFDLTFFTGRRWAGTHSGLLEDFSTAGAAANPTKANLIEYLQNDFHPHWSIYTLEFLSAPMDIGTPTDAGTPTGLHWSYAERKADDFVFGIQAASTAGNLDAVLICSICDEQTSPCRYNGVCNDDRSCTCSPGSVGKMCEDPPLGDGHCDPWFNTDEFNLDGGDCCDSTCISSKEFWCGIADHATEETWSGVEYPSCALAADEWRPNAPIVGREGSFSGRIMALSGTGNVMAIALGQYPREINLYHKDGANWKLQNIIDLYDWLYDNDGEIVSLDIHDTDYNFLPSPLLPTPVHVAIVTRSQQMNTAHMYTCGRGGNWLPQCTKEQYQHDHIQFFHSSHGVTKLAVYDWLFEDQTEERYYEVCFSDDDCITSDFHITGQEELDWRISDDGAAVAGLSWNHSVSALQVQVYAWNGTSFETSSVLQIENGTKTSSIALSSDGTVLAVNVCGPVSKLYIFAWDGQAWQNRRFTDHQDNVNGGHCYKNQPGIPQLSRNGNIVALLQQVVTDDGILADDLLQPVAFNWTGSSWDKIGQLNAAAANSGLSLSGNGLVMAVGFPSRGQQQNGEVLVFSRPGGNSRGCSDNGTSSLRLSFSAHDKWHKYHFYLVNQESGMIVLNGSPDGAEWLQETCVNASSCHTLYVFDDAPFRDGSGKDLLGPGKFGLFFEGEKLPGEGWFDGSMHMKTFGQTCSASKSITPESSNEACRAGSQLMQLMLVVDNPAYLEWSVYNNSTDAVIMQGGPYKVNATRTLIHEESCLDTSNECFFVSMNSQWQGNEVRLYLDGSFQSPTIYEGDTIYYLGDSCGPTPTEPPFQSDPTAYDPEWPGQYPAPVNATNVITFNMRTDGWPSENAWSWSVLNTATNAWQWVAGSVGPLMEAGKLLSNNILLDNEATYQLKITDTFGDGTCCSNGYGWFTLSTAFAQDDSTSGTLIWSETGDQFSQTLDVMVQVDEDGYAHVLSWALDGEVYTVEDASLPLNETAGAP